MGADAGLFAQGFQTSMNVAGAAMNARAARAQGDYERRVMAENARQAELQATDAVRRGRFEAQGIHRATERLIAQQRVAAATQGINPNFGSPLALQGEAKTIGAYDEARITNNAYREALGYQTQANQYRSQGSLASRIAKHKARSSIWLGGAKFLEDSSNLASMYKPSPGGQIVNPPAGKDMSDVRNR